MQLDPTGLTTLDAWQPSPDGTLLAFQLSRGGDEQSVLHVLDVTTGELVDGPIDGCRYSPVAWLPDGKSFYYVRFRQVRRHRARDGPDDDGPRRRGVVRSGDQRRRAMADDFGGTRYDERSLAGRPVERTQPPATPSSRRRRHA